MVIKKLPEVFSYLPRPLYAVLDTARDRKISSLLELSGCEYRILYGKQLALTMDGFGPYLVALPQGMQSLPTDLIQEAWSNSWGIFFTSSAGLPAVLRHLRRLLSIKLPDGRQALFRFYDPRVLRGYLPSCDQMELAQLFGPIDTIYLESVTGEHLYIFRQRCRRTQESPPEPLLMQDFLNLLPGDRSAPTAP